VTLARAGGEVLLEAARGLAPRIDAAAEEIERERRLPPRLVAELVQADLFKMLLPKSVGGVELDLPGYVRVIEQLARADASVAWCVGQSSGLCLLAAYMEPQTARRIFVETTPGILANGPGERNEPGCATRVSGGYRLTGKWNFASGIRHATWLDAISKVEGESSNRFMLFPIQEATLLDTWEVSGLRGTGSFSFTVSDLFVPEGYSAVISDRTRQEHGPLYQFWSSGVFGPTFGSVALGIAHSALGSLIELARDKTPRGLGRLRESATVQAAIARAQARLDGARLLLHQRLHEAWDQACQTGELELAKRVNVRLAATHATHEAKAVVDTAYEAAGSTAIFATQPFERRFRDMHAVTQQLQGRAAHFESVGKFLVGLDPDQQFL